MTKVFLEDGTPVSQPKKAEITHYLGAVSKTVKKIEEHKAYHINWDNIEVIIPKNGSVKYDTMLATKKDGSACIVLGQYNDGAKNKKPIELKRLLVTNRENPHVYKGGMISAYAFGNVQLLRRGCSERLDVMLCWLDGEDKNQGLIYLGHFNDGVVYND